MFDFVNHTLNRFSMLHDWEYHNPNTGMKDQALINHILIKSQKLSMSDISQANPFTPKRYHNYFFVHHTINPQLLLVLNSHLISLF